MNNGVIMSEKPLSGSRVEEFFRLMIEKGYQTHKKDTFQIGKALLLLGVLEKPFRRWEHSQGDVVYFCRLFVAENDRKKGFGSRALDEVLSIAEIAKVSFVCVPHQFGFRESYTMGDFYRTMKGARSPFLFPISVPDIATAFRVWDNYVSHPFDVPQDVVEKLYLDNGFYWFHSDRGHPTCPNQGKREWLTDVMLWNADWRQVPAEILKKLTVEASAFSKRPSEIVELVGAKGEG